MIVLCIKDSPKFGYTRNGRVKVPEELKVKCGEPYTVVEEVTGYGGEKKWRLEEKPKHCRYKKEYFSSISEIEELEEIKELILTNN